MKLDIHVAREGDGAALPWEQTGPQPYGELRFLAYRFTSEEGLHEGVLRIDPEAQVDLLGVRVVEEQLDVVDYAFRRSAEDSLV